MIVSNAGDLGDIAAGAVVDFKFTTVDSTAAFAPSSLGGGPAVSVYKDNSTTQSTAGVTLTTDFDGVAGMHHVRITTVTDGSFYAAGSHFQVVITTGTINGTSAVGYVVASFSIANRPVQGLAAGVITAAAIATDAIGSAEIAATAIAKIADAVLRRQCDNAEASSDGDTLDLSSLYGMIQQAQESAISGSTLTVKKTDGSTTLGTKTVTVDGTTGNVTAIS